MAHFLVRLGDARSEKMTPSLVQDHVAWLAGLSNAGTVILCGPCSDGTAILVLQCPTQEEAERIAGSDPFAREGAYAERSVIGFRLASPENHFLLG
ncbi:YciI family protein [Dokdonella sp.]|uniref:YciI family protein n=1 Tax=Dokdonella sp. TaxID=2291710 RepID=UPI001B221A56|nr:YciI family protein [Dokdonella sp.]MBO9661499.1 hypothetical protein [Dokdonella sp.]